MRSHIHLTLENLVGQIASRTPHKDGWLSTSIARLEEIESLQPYMLVVHDLDSDKENVFIGSRLRKWLGISTKASITRIEALAGYISPYSPAKLSLYYHHFRINEGREYTHVLHVARKEQVYDWLIACSYRLWQSDEAPLVVITLLKPLHELLAEQVSIRESPDTFALSVYETLSTREKQVLRLLSKGLNDTEVAKELTISKYTVKTYRQSLRKKFDVKNTASLVAYTSSFTH